MMLMLVVTSGDGVIGTSDDQLIVMIVIRMRSMSIFLLFFTSWSEATMMLVKERQRLNLTDEPKVSLLLLLSTTTER